MAVLLWPQIYVVRQQIPLTSLRGMVSSKPGMALPLILRILIPEDEVAATGVLTSDDAEAEAEGGGWRPVEGATDGDSIVPSSQ